jgi:hypothetical protein
MSKLQKKKIQYAHGDNHVSSDVHNTTLYNSYILAQSMDENTVMCRGLLRDL